MDIARYINSPGGSVSAGMSIFDSLRRIPDALTSPKRKVANSG